MRDPVRRSYVLAHFCKSQLWHASGISFGFFLTEACALSPHVMGAVMGLALLVNAASDVLVGLLWRHRIVSATSAARRQAIAAVPTCLFFAAFAATPFVPPDALTIFAILSLFGFRLTYSLLDVPQNAIAAFLASTERDRTALLAARNMASSFAALAVGMVAAPAFLTAASAGSLRHVAWAIGIALMACLSALALAGQLARAPAPSTSSIPYAPNTSLPFAQNLAIVIVAVSASTIFRAMEPYAAAFAGTGMGIMIWAPVGTILSQPLWALATGRLSIAAQAGLAAIAAFAATLLLLTAARSHPFGVALIGLGFGIGSGGLWLMLWADLMRRARANDLVLRIGLFTAVSKSAQGAAAIGFGHVLYLSPYRTTLADPSSPPSVMMTAALAATGLCCVALGAANLRISRTARDAGSAKRPPAVPTVQDPVAPVPRSSRVPGHPAD